MAGSTGAVAVQPAQLIIQGQGPLSDDAVMEILDSRAKEWGIPKALYPEVHWDEQAAGDGDTLNQSNVIRLNPYTYIFPGRTLQHESLHAFTDILLATIPPTALPDVVQNAFHHILSHGQFFSVPLLNLETNQFQGRVPMPELSPIQQKLFAGLVSKVIRAREKTFTGNQREFTPLQLSEDERNQLNQILKPDGKVDPAQPEQNEKLLNAVVSYYCQFLNQLLLPNFKFEPLRQALKQHSLSPTAAPVDTDKLIRDNILGLEKNVAAKYEYLHRFVPTPQALAAYYYATEEVDAKLREESLFIQLTEQIRSLKTRGLLEVNPVVQAVLDAEITQLQKRNQALVSGEEEIRRMGRQANFVPLADQSKEIGKQEITCLRDSLLRFYLASPERQATQLADMSGAMRTISRQMSAPENAGNEEKQKELQGRLDRWESSYPTYLLLQKVKALSTKTNDKPAFSVLA